MKSQLSDVELATFSCLFSTAEGMLARATVSNTDCVLIPGASGGGGLALVQLAKLTGARVIALASEAKHTAVEELGADMVLLRHPADLKQMLQSEPVTVDILQRGRRYVCSGAIAGPLVEFDLRTFYLRDLTFLGSTIIDSAVTKNLIDYIVAGEIEPVIAATYPLRELRQAQTAFKKAHTGNIVVTPSRSHLLQFIMSN